MQQTKGKINSPVRLALYGSEGIGKSTLASKFPNPIFVDVEDSTDHLDVARLTDATSYTLLKETVKTLVASTHSFQTVVIDTIDAVERLCTREICAKAQKDGVEAFGYGTGYTYLAEEMARFIDLLSEFKAKGIAVIVIGHATIRKFELPNEAGAYDRWELKLEKKVAPIIKEWATDILFATYKTFVVEIDKKKKAQGGSRIMYTSHNPCWDAKNRHELPPEIPMEIESIKAMLSGIAPKEATTAPVHTQPAQTVVSPVKQEPALAASKAVEPHPVTTTANPAPVVASETPIANATTPVAGSVGIQNVAGFPAALWDLMTKDGVTDEELRKAVAFKGHYTIDTPVANYTDDYVNGRLIAFWPQVVEMIIEQRK